MVKITAVVFWVEVLCGLVCGYEDLAGTNNLHSVPFKNIRNHLQNYTSL
jgi:hypothetical protein